MSESEALYKQAYDLQYGKKELLGAKPIYEEILTRFPGTKEAGYSKSQLKHINNALGLEPVATGPLSSSISATSNVAFADEKLLVNRKKRKDPLAAILLAIFLAHWVCFTCPEN